MPRNDGDIFGAGMRILLVGANEPLPVTAGAIAYLHFVDGDGNTIVPTYEPDGLRTFGGALSGARIVLQPALTPTPWAFGALMTSPGTRMANFGEFVRVVLAGSGGADVFEVVLPTPTVDDIGKPVAVSDYSASGAGTIRISTGSAAHIKPLPFTSIDFFAGNGRTVVWDGTNWVVEA
jgi:hypothetical protein